MNLYRCPTCQRQYLGDAPPAACRWCGGGVDLLCSAPAPFDPAAYGQDLKAHPEKYGNLALLVAALTARRPKKKRKKELEAA